MFLFVLNIGMKKKLWINTMSSIMEDNRISQLDIDINNTLELYDFINDLSSKKQLKMWIDKYHEDLKRQSINYGQVFGMIVLSEFKKLNLDIQDLFVLTNNYIARAEQLHNILSSNEKIYFDYNPDIFLLYLDSLKLQPTDFKLLNDSFHLYLRYCLQYQNTHIFLGIYNRWQIKEN